MDSSFLCSLCHARLIAYYRNEQISNAGCVYLAQSGELLTIDRFVTSTIK
jgi:hypothetical protein